MPARRDFERHLAELDAHSKASLAAFLSLMQLHSRLSRLRTGAMAAFALTHARLRVLRVIATHPGGCISDIARELDLSRQAVHRVVHDLVRMRLLSLTASSRVGRARVPRLAAAGRVAVKCGVGWERHWFERLGTTAATRDLRWLAWLAQRYRRHLPWRADEETEPEMPAIPVPGDWRRVSP